MSDIYYGKCPICGGKTREEEITSSNPYAMTECMEEGCDYRCNQFLTYEDFKELDDDTFKVVSVKASY